MISKVREWLCAAPPGRGYDQTFAQTRDELLQLVRERLLIIPHHPLPFRTLDRIAERVFPQLVEIGTRSPEAVRWLVDQRDLELAPLPDSYPRVLAGRMLLRLLEEVSVPLLLDFVLTGADHSHFERQRAIERVAARGDTRLLEPLLGLVKDPAAHPSVRARAAWAVAEAGLAGSLSAVRSAQAELEEGSVLWGDLMAVRGRLGDAEAFRDLVALDVEGQSAGPFSLIERFGGLERTLAAVYGTTDRAGLPERLARVIRQEVSGRVRVWLFERLCIYHAGWEGLEELAIESLGGSHWRLSRSALRFLRDRPSAAPAILQIAEHEPTPRERRLWTVLALRELDQDTATIERRIGEIRVPLARSIPDAVRAAVLRDIGPYGTEPGTDVRWMIEAHERGARAEQHYDYDALHVRLPALYARLYEEGIPHGTAEDYGVLMSSHNYVSANFYVLPAGGAELRVSLLGPFASTVTPVPRDLERRLRRAADGAGMLWLERDVLEAELTGLVVERYYQHRVWTVGEYLYAWAHYRG